MDFNNKNLDSNLENVDEETLKKIQEQNRINQQKVDVNKIMDSVDAPEVEFDDKKFKTGANVGMLAAQFKITADMQDKYDAFNQMADDYFDSKKIDAIQDSRRRDPLTTAINERNDKVETAMQEGTYIDERDKNFFIHTNPQQYENARKEEEAYNKSVETDVKITEINQQKDLNLQQAELDTISQLTGKDEYGVDRKQTPEDIQAIREKMKLIQELKQNTDVESKIKKPESLTTEELVANNMDLKKLQQQLNREYNSINNELTSNSAVKSK